jgi:hypothetical protein
VPDAAIREIIRSGVSRAQDANTAANQQSLLSAIVLTAQAGEIRVPVPLGPVSALTRMGFLPRDCEAAVDILPGWIRLAAPYGSTFVTTGVSPLGMLNLGS